MPVYRDYEIRMNLNELIEKRVPCCDLLHPDHCFTESQVTQIAHDINMDLDLHPIYKQIAVSYTHLTLPTICSV